ncbi:MAG: bifunctional hydroxymethylpyrimidine kinase/phosphomethylpyrimidine kinase [Coriobacteriales bacterium]
MNESILVIAGSDSIAGAGIQIDIKTAAAHRVHATTALTAVTAQNTVGVTAVHPIPAEVIAAQIDAIFDDVRPGAVKIGMVGCREAAKAIASCLSSHERVPVVLDPVLVATAGGSLADDDATDFLMELLAPLSTVMTPNLPEASALSGIEVVDDESSLAAAKTLLARGASAVLIKGGHGCKEECIDRLYSSSGEVLTMTNGRIPGEYHGTGCSLSTAIACNIACGMSIKDAVSAGVDFMHTVLEDASRGRGALPATRGTKLIDPLAPSFTR